MQTRSIVGTTGRQMAFRQAIAQWRAPLARSISHAGLGLRVSQGSTCCQKFVLNQAVRSLVVAREALRQANTSAKTTTTAPPQSGAAPEAQGYKKPPKVRGQCGPLCWESACPWLGLAGGSITQR
jgi:hypothetical protein